ncbi:MAG: hypothetical protein EOM63_06590 [Clostridia bacterium]|nr:hypothetical protein [Clostridia bacterium]
MYICDTVNHTVPVQKSQQTLPLGIPLRIDFSFAANCQKEHGDILLWVGMWYDKIVEELGFDFMIEN